MKTKTKHEYLADCEDCRKENKVLQAALLIEANEHLSASASALKTRAENRRAALTLLLKVLGMSEEEFEKIYWDVDEKETSQNQA